MKKIVIIFSILIICLIVFITTFYYVYVSKKKGVQANTIMTEFIEKTKPDVFKLYSENFFIEQFDTLEQAIAKANNSYNSYIIKNDAYYKVWDNFLPYNVFVDNSDTYSEFKTFKESVEFAKQHKKSLIYYRKNNVLIWSSTSPYVDNYKIENVPLIEQLPELARGCEVTSLAMLINYNGSKVDKLTLAEKIRKNPAPKQYKNGILHYGNPHNGFIGDMYDIKKDGLGVYNEPIHELLTNYFPDSSLNLTGSNFDDIIQIIRNNSPVWVIINVTFAPLPAKRFETWQTEDGSIDVTYSEHSVLITGYDNDFIYFNDPLNRSSSAPRTEFIAAWEQMGRQAIAISK